VSASEVITILAQYGLPTVLLFVGGWLYISERRAWDAERRELTTQITAESRERVEDAKLGFETLRGMQEVVTSSVGKLADIAETRDLQRELIDAVTKVTTVAETLQRRADLAERGPFSGGRKS